ncbi:MAG TPA: hypothetical protein VFW70_03220 [Methylomirabilota bacterium]|nr:hypothetical protein [Methylomirabilota bacterium]
MRIALFVFWVVVAVLMLLSALRRRSLPNTARPLPTDELVKDPVCQTYIVRSRAVSRETAGGPRYFCSPACAARFAG